MNLIDTVELMNSVDYKDRFKAEYLQTKIRYDKLHKLIRKFNRDFLLVKRTDDSTRFNHFA